MNDPNMTEKRGGVKTLLGIIAAIAVIVLIVGVIALFIDKIAMGIAIALLAIGAVLLILALIVGPYYIVKGEKIQTNMSYDLDDVQSVKESSGSDKKE